MDVPVELIITILELSYFNDDGLPDLATFKSSSLVCRKWTVPAQQLLFRSGTLRRDRYSSQQLHSLFSDSPKGSYVRHLTLDLSQPPGRVAYSPHEFLPMISLFPRLYELELCCFNFETFDALIAALDAANPLELPQLRALKLTAMGRGSNLLFRFLELWPSIRFLSFNIGRHVSPPPVVPQLDLHLLQVGYLIPPTLETLRWLIPNHSLRIFEVKSQLGDSTEPFLAEEGKYLHSLRIPNLFEQTTVLLPLCTNLEELDVNYLLIKYLGRITDSFPATLEHIRIRRLVCDWTEIRDFIRAMSPPNLRLITLPQVARDSWVRQSSEGWEEFEKECQGRNLFIAYNCWNSSLDDDPVASTHFPRGRSVANFTLMN